MARFIALPVRQGDAFYLERDGFSVLIDGGQNRSALPTIYRQHVRHSNGVNVLICTHNDADHANGVLGFLEGGLRCREGWLPGRWIDVFPDVLRPFSDVWIDLVESTRKIEHRTGADEGYRERSPLEAYGERLAVDSEQQPDGSVEWVGFGEGGWPEQYAPMLEQAQPWGTMLGHMMPADLLWSAIDAASRIRAIAIEAFHRGISVRWFEFDKSGPSGGCKELQPINSRMIAGFRPPAGDFLYRLALTVANRESLVFWSPPTIQHPGALFTADSDLAWTTLPSNLRGSVVTAPHHGSEANALAYRAVEAAAGGAYSTITWVRSDGKYKTRPGKSYLGLPSRRLCTLCRCSTGSATAKQPVRLYSRHSKWIRQSGSALCTCV